MNAALADRTPTIVGSRRYVSGVPSDAALDSLIAAAYAALGSNSAVTMNPTTSTSLLFTTSAPAIGSLATSGSGASSVVLWVELAGPRP